MERCCFYGSLRKGAYNYERFVSISGEENMKYIKTIELSGYRLYSLGDNVPYPAAVLTSNKEDKIIVDLFELSDGVFEGIEFMEKGADYYEDLVCIDDKMYSIFLFSSDKIRHTNYINSGDWISYFSKQDFIKDLKRINS